jgi:hypothetical protein
MSGGDRSRENAIANEDSEEDESLLLKKDK